MVVDCAAEDIVYTSLFSGVHGSYLKPSVRNNGMDPDNLPEGDKADMDFGKDMGEAKAWRDIWSAGQGVGSIHDILPAGAVIERMKQEYDAALAKLAGH